jgi:hypothetical protein
MIAIPFQLVLFVVSVTIVSAACAMTPAATVATVAPRVAVPLLADSCVGDPKFITKFGLSRRSLVDTSRADILGLSVIDVDAKGTPTRRFQHPSWTQAGSLGRVQRDRFGNIYVYPAPAVNVANNPVEKSNFLYRIDSETGEMAPFAELPKAGQAASNGNPFGLMALAYDCDQESLYVSTLYASTASEERGLIARVDLKTKAVTVVRRGIDVLSLTVGRESDGRRRLYAGAVRDNVIVSYPIESSGALGGSETVEIHLDGIAVAQDKRPRVLRFDARGQLSVRSIPFDYALTARTSIPSAELRFSRDSSSRKFKLIEERAVDRAPSN